MYCKELDKLIYKRHEDNHADQLLIVGGYVSYVPVEEISKENIDVTVIYGAMRKDRSFGPILHNKYCEVTNRSPQLKVYYQKKYNHSKIYCWRKSGKIVEILAGSANFSVSGLTNPYQESLFDVGLAAYHKTDKYIRDALNNSEICTSYHFKPSIKSKSLKSVRVHSLKLDKVLSDNPPSAELSLRSSQGTFEDSGINIGQKSLTGSKVNIDDCYIPLRADLIDALPYLFPNKGINPMGGAGYARDRKRASHNAEFVFDDGKVMAMKFAQTGLPEMMESF